jgi:hypothetical protein
MLLVALTIAGNSTRAEWKTNQPGQGPDEVRVWASPKETGLDFHWSGKTNARHEAEGFGILEWYKMEKNPEGFGRVANSVYTGELKAGKRHGTGVAVYRSGAKYSGQWKANVKEGKGEYWYSSGDYYAGFFQNDLMHGTGRYTSMDGTVFEGTFVADERDGPGEVILPDGRRYTSKWAAGKDTSPGGAPLPDKPYLMLGLDVRPYALNGKMYLQGTDAEPHLYLTYRGKWEDGTFVIDSDWPYWVAWSKGGPVGTAGTSPEGFDIGTHPVYLDLRLINRGRTKLEIRKAEAVVEESYPDLEPILQVQDATQNGGVSCKVLNFSSNQVESCEIAFNILPPDALPTFEKFQFVEKTEPFLKSGSFSLARAMATLGLDAAAIAAIETTGTDSREWKQVERSVRKSLSKFPAFVESSSESSLLAYGLIAGEIRLGWTDRTGAKQTKRVKFQFRQCFAQFGVEEGAPGATSGKYDVMLKTSGEGYLVSFAYKPSIAAGANDRFTLQLASPASSYQRFRIRLTTADGREILSPPCRLHFLVPRNFSWKDGHVIEDP